MIDPSNDGVDHINIYSKGATSLGRWLSNFTECDITTEDGDFKSIEGYWYWLLSDSPEKERLRNLSGWKAKSFGREIKASDWCQDNWFQDKIKKALKEKIKQAPENFKTSTLPFTHYYVYGGKVVEVTHGGWIIEYIEELRKPMKNFTLVNCDTDAIMVCKPDSTPFTKEEQASLLQQLNEQFPERIRWEADGVFEFVAVLGGKNYILYDGKAIKLKGSALRDPKRSPALKEFMDEVIDAMVFEKGGYTEIYNKYVKEILDVKDIKRWSSRKTLSSTMLKSDRTNETRVVDALAGSNYVEGDRFYTFYESPEKITLVENFSGVYDKKKLLGSLYDKAEIFSTVLPTKELFIKYTLKKNEKLLNDF